MKNKFILLTLILVLYFLGKSIIPSGTGEYILSIILLVLIVVSLYEIGHEKHLVIICALLFGISLAIISIAGDVYYLTPALLITQTILAILFFSILGFATLKYTLFDKEVSINNLWGAISAYLLIGLIWSYIYELITLFDSHAFNVEMGVMYYQDQFVQLNYFSFTTLTTLGYGDIVPVSDIARTLSWMEALMGQVYLTVLIAQLVGQYVAKK